MKKKLLFALSLLGFWATTTKAQLSVTQNSVALTLAQNLVGSGVTISNATFTGNANQAGIFTNGNSVNLGFNSGIVLSTGYAVNVANPASAFASAQMGSAGDATLNSISGGSTADASVLQFDFVTQGTTLNFRYVFGSEEYPEYVCSQFNDIFGFFISGPNPGGGNYTNSNIALIPNTSLSVAINAVNSGQPGSGYSGSGCTSLGYSQYYINNMNGSYIVYDGYTTVLNAQIAVVPCQTYHIKLAIADVSDDVFDSGVFLESNSFESQSASITPFFDPGFTSTFEGCVGGGFEIKAPQYVTSSTAINYTVTGTATNGVDYPPLSGTAYLNPGTSSALVYMDPFADNITEGPETVTLTIYDQCTGLPTDSATITINEPPADTAYAAASDVCVGSTVQLTATGGGTYSWTPTTGLSDPTIANPVATITGNMTYQVDITFGTCSRTRYVTVRADSISVDAISLRNGPMCPGMTDTLYADKEGGVAPFTYQWSPAAQVSDPTAQAVTTTPASTTTYTVTVTDDIGCSASDSYTVTISTNLHFSLGADVNVCPENSPHTLSVPGGPFDSYLWSSGDTTATISVSTDGSYSVTVWQGSCSFSSDTIDVHFLHPVNPTLANTGFCAGSQATLQAAAGSTNILWNTGDSTTSIAVTAAGSYYYTALDADGCFIRSDTATVVENPLPLVHATASPDTICPGGSSILSSGAASGLSYQWSTNENTTSITVTTAGTYYLTVSDAVCAAYDSVTVYEYQNPNPTVAQDTTVCSGESVVFTLLNGPFQSYSWSTGDTAVTSITVAAAGVYQVTVNDGVCDWISNEVHLNNFPTPVPTLADTGACSGETITLSVENGLVHIVWSNGDTTQTVIVSSDATYSYTAEDVHGCPVASDTVSVTFRPAPTVNAQAAKDTICAGSSTTISANATGSNLSYLWSPTGDTTAAITVSQQGVYTVEVNNGFCPAYDTVEIYQYQFPPVTLPDSNVVCSGTPVVLIPSGGPYVSYMWSDSATTASDTVIAPGVYSVTVNNGTCDLVSNNFTLINFAEKQATLPDTGACLGNTIVLNALPGLLNLTWNTGATTDTIQVAATGNFYYTAIDSNGCDVFSDTAAVTFNQPLAVTVNASPDTICQGGSSVLTAQAPGSNLTYLWQPGGDTTASITVSQQGAYSVTVNDGSCPGSDTVVIAQYPPVSVALAGDTTVCPGTPVTFAPNDTFVSYHWSTGATTPTLTTAAEGFYWVTVNDGHCDYVTDSVQLSHFQTPSAHAYSDTSVCVGQPVTLTADTGFTAYGWSNSQTGNTITVTTAGAYSYTATYSNGCLVQSDTVVVSNRPYPTPNIVAAPPVICVGQGHTTLNAGSQQGVTYTWLPMNVTGDTVQVSDAGTYVVQANLAGCVAYDTLTVNASTPPMPHLDPFVLSCCQTVTLNPAAGNATSYTWSDGSTDSTLAIQTTGDSAQLYSVTVTNGDGCSATATTSVLIKCINAVASALPDTIMMGDSAQLNVVTEYATHFNYQWSPTAGLSDSAAQNPTAAPTKETIYTVVVTDVADGCVDTAEVTVFVLYGDKIAMPNAFTPNGDGRNDVFYPVLLGDYQQVMEFRVYDRWGALIHNSTNPWDGTFKGKGQPAETYVYYVIVRVPDMQNMGATKDIKLTGSFTLIR